MRQEHSEYSIKRLDRPPTNVIKIRPKDQIKDQISMSSKIQKKQKAKSQNLQQIQLSSNIDKHKLPGVILNYIKEQAKQKRDKNPSKLQQSRANKSRGNNRFMQVASKITQNKKIKQKYITSKCQICLMDVPETQKQSMSACQHEFCTSCLHQYIIFKISSFQGVQCPNQNCHKSLDQKSKCYSQLPLDARKKYKKYKQYSQTLQNPGLKLCPNEQCQGFLQLKQSTQQNTVLITSPKCNKCERTYCSRCFFEEHEGECDPHQLSFFQVTLHYRQCSKCKNVIEKSSGCNHMTCRCGYQFCYVCGGKWTHSHLCNNPDGQPVFNEAQCNCCCCVCDIACCQCCNQCMQTTCECLNNCCQCFCENCCQPFCNFCESFCQYLACGCQCCQNPCFNGLKKCIVTMFILSFLVPAILLQLFFIICIKILVAIGLGLFGFCCLIQENQIQVEWYHVLIGILLLPLTILYFLYLGFKSVFNEEGTDQLKEVLCLPFQLISNVCDE